MCTLKPILPAFRALPGMVGFIFSRPRCRGTATLEQSNDPGCGVHRLPERLVALARAHVSAIDMVMGAVRDEYDVAVLVSADTDLVPAIEAVLNLGKRAEVASWRPDEGWGSRLSLPGRNLWCHWLDHADFDHVHDETDYTRRSRDGEYVECRLGIRVAEGRAQGSVRSWLEGTHGSHVGRGTRVGRPNRP